MCGIAGLFDATSRAEPMPSTLRRMGAVLAHRGPDQSGSVVVDALGAGLTCRRLSLVDLAGGRQPISNEDDSVHVVCNGEIYNHRDLAKSLSSKGHVFRTRSDTEVIAHLYEDHGVECLAKLRGMFALAVLDRRNRSLLLARDGAGMKHLYWCATDSGLVFGSELKALLASGYVAAEADRAVVARALFLGYVPAPKAPVRGVEKLPAGGWILATEKGIQRGRFWRPRFVRDGAALSEREYAEQLERLLEQSVQSHLDADVPVGAFLSGGWDSSLVAALAARRTEGTLRTYSIVFPESPDVDESQYSRRMAEHLGTRHTELEFRSSEFPFRLADIVRHIEEPSVGEPGMLIYGLSGVASRDVKAVLSGEGSDELFGGYQWFKSRLGRIGYATQPVFPSGLAQRLQPLGASTRWRLLFRLLSAPTRRQADAQWLGMIGPDIPAELLKQDLTLERPDLDALLGDPELLTATKGAFERQLMMQFQSHLADGILLRSDKTSMAHGLEIRMPFLHRGIIDFALGLPARMKLRGSQEKYVLSLLTHHLPPRLRQRRKQPLSAPSALLRHPAVLSVARELLLDDNSGDEFFERSRMETYLDHVVAGRVGNQRALWGLLTLRIWARDFLRHSWN